MNDEIIGQFFSQNEEDEPLNITARNCYVILHDMTKILYMDYMTRVLEGDYEDFRETHLRHMGKILDFIHNRLEDHSYGIRKQLFDAEGIKDPRRYE